MQLWNVLELLISLIIRIAEVRYSSKGLSEFYQHLKIQSRMEDSSQYQDYPSSLGDGYTAETQFAFKVHILYI